MPKGNKPTHVARIKDGSAWKDVGAAWALPEGKEGFSVKLFALPPEGSFALFPITEKKD